MGRVVILEGPDGGGKTTLAKKLVEAGFEYKHEGPPPDGVDLISYYLRVLQDSLLSFKHVVHDRLWLGERIYGPIARGEDRIGDEGQILFERLYRSKPIHQYICSPEYGIAKTNYLEKIRDKNDYLKSEVMWESVYKDYDKWLERNLLGSKFNYSTDDYQMIIDRILDFKVILNNLPEGTIGSPKAKYLFIGDKPNHLTIDVPFFSVRGSSGYLNKALKLADIKEEDLALSNAKSATGEKHSFDSTLKKLPNLEKIFLMGNIAKEWYFRQVTHETCETKFIPHPSYLKRFRGHNPQVMADIIIEEIYG